MAIPVLLDETRAAEVLGLSVRTIQRWRREGLGPVYCKLGSRRVGYLEDDLEQYLKQARRVVPATTGIRQ